MAVRPSTLWLVVCSTALLFAVGCGNRQVISLLRVGRSAPTASDHQVYTETQATLLKSSFVVAAALRNPEISELEVVKSHDDPVAWLASSLRVDRVGDSELLRVSMAVAADADQTSKIVDAVVDAFLAEIVLKEQTGKLVMLDELRQRAETVRERLRSKTDKSLRSELSAIQRDMLKLEQELAGPERIAVVQRATVMP